MQMRSRAAPAWFSLYCLGFKSAWLKLSCQKLLRMLILESPIKRSVTADSFFHAMYMTAEDSASIYLLHTNISRSGSNGAQKCLSIAGNTHVCRGKKNRLWSDMFVGSGKILGLPRRKPTQSRWEHTNLTWERARTKLGARAFLLCSTDAFQQGHRIAS